MSTKNRSANYKYSGDHDVYELICQYREYECLWNINNVDYRNRAMKQEAWMQIAEHFGLEPEEIKRKVKNLRSAYLLEKKKVDNSILAGDDPPHTPMLYYYKYLTFLESNVILRKVNPETDIENIQLTQDPGEDQFVNFTKTEEVVIDYEPEDEEYVHFGKREIEDVDLEPGHESSPEQSPESSCEPSPATLLKKSSQQKKPFTTTKRPTFRRVIKQELSNPGVVRNSPKFQQRTSTPKIYSTKSLSPRRPNTTKLNKTVNDLASVETNRNNIFTSFGTTIALQLQQLPIDAATVTMSEIHTILTKKTLEYLKSSQKPGNVHRNSNSEEEEESADDIIQAAIYNANIK